MSRKPWLLVPLLLGALLLAATAHAQPPAQTLSRGAVVGLRGTPHLWIVGDDALLHWAGDTRALSGRTIDWGNRRDVSLDELKALSRGDPWLSAGLLKIGDPIYLVKWETSEARPTLLHIQSIQDVELFGINSANYGSMVMDKTTWEQKFGMSSDPLTRGVLAPAVPPAATAAPAATATPAVTLVAKIVERKKNSSTEYQTKIEVSGARAGDKLKVSASGDEWECSPSCTSTRPFSWGPIDAGTADSTGKLTFTDTHGPYKSYTYTFQDTAGNKVSITVDDDLNIT